MTILPYSPNDHGEIIARWWTAHTGRVFQHALLPPVGLVGSDEHGPCCAVWLYMSVGIGVAFLENPVTRPGLSMRKAKLALTTLFKATEEVALTHDYGLIMCHSKLAGKKMMESIGYSFMPETFITGSKLIKQ